VKSMGVELKARNLAQVSINLTDFEQTPMHRVYEMVKREAARYGAAPVGSEIVGLIPKKAIEMATDYFLQVENFSPAQVFENRLQAALTGQALEPATKEGKLAGLAQPFLEAVAAANGNTGRRKRFRPCRRARGVARANGGWAFAQKEITGCVCKQAIGSARSIAPQCGGACGGD